MQDIDYENELELLYAVVTKPGADETVEAQLHFIDDDTGMTKRLVSLPQWDEVNNFSWTNGQISLASVWLFVRAF